MATANNRRPQPGRVTTETIMLWVVLSVAAVALLTVYAAVRIGHRIAGLPSPPTDPWAVLFGVARGDVAWPLASTGVAAGVVVVLFLLALVAARLVARRRDRASRVDPASRYMGRGRDIETMSERSASTTATRLGVASSPGVPIGRTVATKAALFGSWEDMQIDIAGPRTGKTTSIVVPAILEAPGAVLVTSNKRDVVDATRDVRAVRGDVWVFDPQAIVGEEPSSWWWNPLTYVIDEVKAAKLAEHFAAGSRDAGAKTDAFFDPAAQDLLAGLLLAAALDDRPITDVYKWLTRPSDDEPVRILAAGGYDLTSDQVAGVVFSPEKQRGGVYGTAQQMASCLTNRQAARWVTPAGHGDARRQFDPVEFLRHGGTLYSLSKEGRGTAGPLVTALTVAVVEAAEEQAARSAGGRLKIPLLGVLDEAANVCRWRELPNLYSHYGSRGVVLMTILQSWSQGVDVWGESGMRKLWSASNVKVYGGGVAEVEFLENLSKVIGDYDKRTSSVTYSKGSRSMTEQLHRERILDVADLAALPKGRAIVIASRTSGCGGGFLGEVGRAPTLPGEAGQGGDAVRGRRRSPAHLREQGRARDGCAGGHAASAREPCEGSSRHAPCRPRRTQGGADRGCRARRPREGVSKASRSRACRAGAHPGGRRRADGTSGAGTHAGTGIPGTGRADAEAAEHRWISRTP